MHPTATAKRLNRGQMYCGRWRGCRSAGRHRLWKSSAQRIHQRLRKEQQGAKAPRLLAEMAPRNGTGHHQLQCSQRRLRAGPTMEERLAADGRSSRNAECHCIGGHQPTQPSVPAREPARGRATAAAGGDVITRNDTVGHQLQRGQYRWYGARGGLAPRRGGGGLKNLSDPRGLPRGDCKDLSLQ